MAVAAQARPLNVDATIAELKALFGDRVSTAHAVREQHGKDISYHEAHPIIPFGTGTSLEGHISAPNGGISLDVSRMNRILQVNEADLDVVVQPGVTRKQLNEYRATRPVLPDRSRRRRLDRRHDGDARLRHQCGALRHHARERAGLTVVLADGRIIQTGGRSRKSSGGLRPHAAVRGLRGHARHHHRNHAAPLRCAGSDGAAVAAFPDIGAVNTVIQTIQSGIPVARIELLDDLQIDAVNKYSKLSLPVRPAVLRVPRHRGRVLPSRPRWSGDRRRLRR
jgi:D-lactate dehydrogenase (cytochrome)